LPTRILFVVKAPSALFVAGTKTNAPGFRSPGSPDLNVTMGTSRCPDEPLGSGGAA
jgi:hypothetical protein